MKLDEILNTKPKATWSRDQDSHVATFNLEDAEYEISLTKFDVPEGTLVYFVFKRDGTINAKGGEAPAAKVLGAVLNTAMPEIKAIKPDIILIAVRKDSGIVDSRKRIYDMFVTFVASGGSYSYASKWEENSLFHYRLIAKDSLTPQQLDYYREKSLEIEDVKP